MCPHVDSGLVVVGFITLVYIILVFGLFFYVKNEWCELLFKNNTENPNCRRQYSDNFFMIGGDKDSDSAPNIVKPKKLN